MTSLYLITFLKISSWSIVTSWGMQVRASTLTQLQQLNTDFGGHTVQPSTTLEIFFRVLVLLSESCRLGLPHKGVSARWCAPSHSRCGGQSWSVCRLTGGSLGNRPLDKNSSSSSLGGGSRKHWSAEAGKRRKPVKGALLNELIAVGNEDSRLLELM